MNKDFAYQLQLSARIASYLVLNVAFVVALVVRFGDQWGTVFQSNNYIALLLFLNLSWVAVTNVLRYFKPSRLNVRIGRRLFVFIQVAVLHLLLVLAFNGIIKTYYSRLFLIYFFGQLLLIIPIIEVLIRGVLSQQQRKKGSVARVAIAGVGKTTQELAHYFRSADVLVYRPEVIELSQQTDGLLEQLKHVHQKTPINELYCSANTIPAAVLTELSTYCENQLIRVRLIVDFPKWDTKPLETVFLNSIPIINVPFTPLDEPANKMIKRTFDILFSSFVVVFVLSWLFPLLAIFIKLSSRGPVIFKQKRTGLDNKEFECYKFRSMRPNEEANLIQATENDPRITPIGRFMRSTSLDEMPQFINVLRGEMSVVGPRPHMLKHTEEYAHRVGSFMQRHAILPGVTGLAQVKGYRGEITHFEHLANRIKYDRFYVENWSLMLDIKIVLLTVFGVMRSK